MTLLLPIYVLYRHVLSRSSHHVQIAEDIIIKLQARARQLSIDEHSVCSNSLVIQISIPLPQGSGAVDEGQDAVAIAGFPEC